MATGFRSICLHSTNSKQEEKDQATKVSKFPTQDILGVELDHIHPKELCSHLLTTDMAHSVMAMVLQTHTLRSKARVVLQNGHVGSMMVHLVTIMCTHHIEQLPSTLHILLQTLRTGAGLQTTVMMLECAAMFMAMPVMTWRCVIPKHGIFHNMTFQLMHIIHPPTYPVGWYLGSLT